MSLPKQHPLSYDEVRQIADPYERYLQWSNSVDRKHIDKGYIALNPAERDLLHVSLLETEVNNGGFDQYFFNTAGDYALATVETLRRIGSSEALALLRQAVAVFGATPPATDRTIRQSQMEDLPETAADLWEELDEQFWTLEEPLWQLVLTHAEGQD
jgi:hypothetical protein